jgi:hypothetical protein
MRADLRETWKVSRLGLSKEVLWVQQTVNRMEQELVML